MIRELTPIDITHQPDLLRLAEEVERTGRPRRLRRGDRDVALLVPARSDPKLAGPNDIWAGYDPERVRQAFKASVGALANVDTEQLKADLKAQREQNSVGRPA